MPRLLSPLLALSLLAGCTGGAPAPAPSPSATPHTTDAADATACARFAGAPVAIAAQVGDAGSPPEVALNRRYDVAIGATNGGRGGTVTFYAPRAAEWSVYLTEDVPLMARDASGLPMTLLERYTGSTHCPDIRSHVVLLLDPGPVAIELGPTTADHVGLVIEETHP